MNEDNSKYEKIARALVGAPQEDARSLTDQLVCEQTISPWISVAERLPARDQRVLYYFKAVGMHLGRYLGQATIDATEDGPEIEGPAGAIFGSPGAGWLTGDVTHWMPVPEPPL